MPQITGIRFRNYKSFKNEYAEIPLNKINVFMGPQSSGKSTIAKIISYCSWFEKNTILSTKQQKDFYNELLEFHNLEDGYFSDNSYLEYENENCHIIFHGKNVENLIVHTNVNSKNIFRNEKRVHKERHLSLGISQLETLHFGVVLRKKPR